MPFCYCTLMDFGRFGTALSTNIKGVGLRHQCAHCTYYGDFKTTSMRFLQSLEALMSKWKLFRVLQEVALSTRPVSVSECLDNEA